MQSSQSDSEILRLRGNSPETGAPRRMRCSMIFNRFPQLSAVLAVFACLSTNLRRGGILRIIRHRRSQYSWLQLLHFSWPMIFRARQRQQLHSIVPSIRPLSVELEPRLMRKVVRVRDSAVFARKETGTDELLEFAMD